MAGLRIKNDCNQTTTNTSVCDPESLPRVPGPKLGPFTSTALADIKFLSELGDGDNKDSHVWKVQINIDNEWKMYALKMFKPNITDCEYQHHTSVKYFDCQDVTEKDFREGYLSPFGCECRAYGRLKEHGREDLAHKAHGYLLITYQQQLELLRACSAAAGYEFAPSHLDQLWGRPEKDRLLPVKAIVKELVPAESATCGIGPRASQARKAWEDLEALHRLGIFVLDIQYWNYLDGKLIDFSRALTSYHPCLDSCPHGDDDDDEDDNDNDKIVAVRTETKIDGDCLLQVIEATGSSEVEEGWDETNAEFIQRLYDASREYEYKKEEGLIQFEDWEQLTKVLDAESEPEDNEEELWGEPEDPQDNIVEDDPDDHVDDGDLSDDDESECDVFCYDASTWVEESYCTTKTMWVYSGWEQSDGIKSWGEEEQEKTIAASCFSSVGEDCWLV